MTLVGNKIISKCHPR